MIPNKLDDILINEINHSNFLQPLELLGGQSLCDIKLNDPVYLSEALNNLLTTERISLSLFEEFIVDLTDAQREKLFNEDYLLPV